MERIKFLKMIIMLAESELHEALIENKSHLIGERLDRLTSLKNLLIEEYEQYLDRKEKVG